MKQLYNPKNYDLKDAADEQYQADEFRLVYNKEKLASLTFVLVESPSDERFFQKLLNPTQCFFYVTDGVEKLLAILQLPNLPSAPSLIIGIADADLRRITNNFPAIGNIFWTDFHDKELLMAFSDAWQNVLEVYVKPKKYHIFEKSKNSTVLDFLMQTIMPIGVLRLLNEQQSWGLRFKNRSPKDGTYKYINYADFIDKTTLLINIDKLLKEVENKSETSKQNFFTKNPANKTLFINTLQQPFDLQQLCNGHDLSHALSIALEKVLSNAASSSKISAEFIEMLLIIAYRTDDFRKTKLYQALLHWQNANNAIVLR